jgi:EmrB/QacA subfamily drug resistance transporter
MTAAVPTPTVADTTATARPPLRGRPWLVLLSVSFGLFLVGLDATVVSIVNPSIAADLHTSFAQLQWVTHGYLLGLAVFLILAGKLGDRYGHRRLFVAGLVVFAIASVGIATVGTTAGVIGFRVLQGVGAALLMPQTLALLRATFPREKFGMAVGIWGGVSSIAIAAGPTVAGALDGAFGWGAVFWINLPVVVVGLVMAALFLPRTSFPGETRLDVRGVVVLALGLVAVVFTIVQSESWGWGDPRTLGLLAVGVLLLVGFVALQARTPHALLPLDIFRGTTVGAGGLVLVANMFVLVGVTFFLPMFFMGMRGADPLQAGLMLVPLSALSIVTAPVGALFVAKAGTRVAATVSLSLTTAGLLVLLTTTVTSPYGMLAVGFVLLAFGTGMTMTAAAEAIVGSAPLRYAGVAGGFQATCIQLGGAIGTAVLSAIIAASTASGTAGLGLSTDDAHGLALATLPEGVDAATRAVLEDAYVTGMHRALLTAAVLVAVVAVVANLSLRRARRVSAAEVLEETVEGEAGHA